MTPNLADAICFTREFALSPPAKILNLSASSPPSPLQEAPLILFMPTARVSCASLDKAPWDILPLPNLLRIFSIGSTSERSIGGPIFFFLKLIKSLKFIGGKLYIPSAYFLYAEYEFEPTALCNK